MPTLQGLLGYLTEGGAPVRNALKGLLSGDLTPLQNAGAELSALANPTMQQKQKLAGILAGNGQSQMGYDEVMNNPGVQAAMNFAPMGVGVLRGVDTGLPHEMLIDINKGRGLLGKNGLKEITNKYYPLSENQQLYQTAKEKAVQIDSDIAQLRNARKPDAETIGLLETRPYMRNLLAEKGAVGDAVDIMKTTPANFQQSYLSALRQNDAQKALSKKQQSSAQLNAAIDDAFSSPIAKYWHKSLSDKVRKEVEWQHSMDALNRRGQANIDVEGKAATLEAIAREAKKRGMKVDYVSAKSSHAGGSQYIQAPDGRIVRISDHELPDTPQRQFNRSQGLTGRWSDEILLDDWRTMTMDDYINRIISGPAD